MTMTRTIEEALDHRHRRQRLGADWSASAWHVGGLVYLVDNEDGDGGYTLIKRDVALEGETGADTVTEVRSFEVGDEIDLCLMLDDIERYIAEPW